MPAWGSAMTMLLSGWSGEPRSLAHVGDRSQGSGPVPGGRSTRAHRGGCPASSGALGTPRPSRTADERRDPMAAADRAFHEAGERFGVLAGEFDAWEAS